MLVEIAIAIIIGCFLGIFTGLTPGIHINLVAALIFATSPFLIVFINPFFIAVAIVSMSIVHTFLDFIPSCFLGAPEENTFMSVLPGHRLLLEGKGFEAVKLATIGSFFGLLLTLLLLPLLLFAIPSIYFNLQDYIGYILLAIAIFMILREDGIDKKFWSFFIFALSGIFGVVVFSLHINEPLFPMLSGIFGISMLLTSLSQKANIPEQKITNDIHVSKKEFSKSIFAGTISGTLVSIFPGMGPAQAAILGSSLVGKVKEHMYLVLTGAIGTVSMLLSLITLYTINKARNGSIIVVQKILENVDINMFLLLMSISLIAGCIAVFLTMFFTRIFTKIISKVNYAALCIAVIAFVSVLVFIFSGWLGLFVLLVSTSIGILPGPLQVGRNHAMGCLLMPVVLYFVL